jgi:pyrimidine operon attenuation protein/uracil phosphoribosyltransferase
MKVIDITYSDLDHFYDVVTERLFAHVKKDEMIAVVGIANSGLELSSGVFKRLQNKGYSNAMDYGVRCKRPHSSSIDTIGKIYRILPIPPFISNSLRYIEHQILGKFRPKQRTVEFLNHSDTKISKCDHILIIDDAVDSGHSMKAVYQEIQKHNSHAKIDLAAYAITQQNPVIEPAVYQYRNVIVRFPWAMDRQ